VVRISILLIAVSLALTARRAEGQEQPGLTPTVFGRYADRIVKVDVRESGSAARAGMGSGFFISASGHIVTNYHVIADLIQNPDRYHAEVVHGATTSKKVTILAIDVVHDLAILRTDLVARHHFALGAAPVRQGDRLYSLGHPNDLGLSIVEGTHNGLLQHTLYPKLHFTGSINPGMSGGPAITADGRVVGINVSTSGNQISFLVPAEPAARLAATALAATYHPPAKLIDEVGAQVRAYQDVYLKELFTDRSKTVDLARYRVVTEPAPFFRCWGDATRSKELAYERANHRCSTDDYVFIASEQQSGIVSLTHELVTTASLGASRFFALYTDIFQNDNTPGGDEEHVTSWRCKTSNVRNAAAPMRVVLCLRRYHKLGELYDSVLKVAVLGRQDSGLVSTLTLSGVSFENVARLTSRYLDRIRWR
jgi:serine protease Do